MATLQACLDSLLVMYLSSVSETDVVKNVR